MNAADLMTRDIVTVRPELPLADAIRLMLGHRVSGVPVVTGAGQLIGLLTTGDLLRRVETCTDTPREGWMQAFMARGQMVERYVHTHGRRVQDAMTHNVATVNEASRLDDIVHIMESCRVRRVPVVQGERLVGIVSRSDLVRALSAMLDDTAALDGEDGAIHECILAEMARHRWTPGRNVQVTVREGVVEFLGDIFDERMRDALRVIAEAVPGVKAVQDNLLLVDLNSVLVYGV